MSDDTPIITDHTFESDFLDTLRELHEQPKERHCAECIHPTPQGERCPNCGHTEYIPVQNPNLPDSTPSAGDNHRIDDTLF